MLYNEAMNTSQYFPFRLTVQDYGNLSLSFDESPQQGTFLEHSHNQIELFLFLEGDAEMVIDGKIYPLRENDLLIIPEGLPHHLHLKSAKPYRRYIFHARAAHIRDIGLGGLIDQFCADAPRTFDLAGTPFLQSIAQGIRMAISAPPALQRTLFDERLTALYSALLSCAAQQTQTRADELVEQAVWLINSKLEQRLTIDSIAEQLYTSGSYLCRIFRQKMGIPLMHYVNRQRIQLARELIQEGTPLKEVYLRCGYENYVTFFRVFRAETGISPSALARGK